MPGFNPNEYETVDARLHRFWEANPQGRVLPDLVFHDENRVAFRVEIYTDRDDTRPAAIGHAEEVVGSSPVNRTNAFENAETSAIGRALANLGYSTKGQRPSREEMEKAERGRGNSGAPQQRNGNANGDKKQAPTKPPAEKAREGAVALLDADSQKRVDALVGYVPSSGAAEQDVTKQLTDADRAALTLDQSDKLTLGDLADTIAGFWAKNGRGPRMPQPAAVAS